MKKRNMIIIAALLVIVLIAAGCGKQQSGSAEQNGSAPEAAPEETMPEPGTVYLDKEKKMSATMGVAVVDEASVEDEEPEDTAPAPKSSTAPAPTPKTSATPAPTPSATPVPSPSPTEPPSSVPEKPALTEYEVFYALSPEQKDAFLNSFESYEAFFEWLVAAQAEYAALHPEIEIAPGGSIDLSQLGS